MSCCDVMSPHMPLAVVMDVRISKPNFIGKNRCCTHTTANKPNRKKNERQQVLKLQFNDLLHAIIWYTPDSKC